MQEQHRQQLTLPGAAECKHAVLLNNLERPQNSKLDHTGRPDETLPPHAAPNREPLGGHLPTVDRRRPLVDRSGTRFRRTYPLRIDRRQLNVRPDQLVKKTAPLALAVAVIAAPAVSANSKSGPTMPLPGAPTIVRVTAPNGGFDWGDAGIGAAGGFALSMIALGGAVAASGRRPRHPGQQERGTSAVPHGSQQRTQA